MSKAGFYDELGCNDPIIEGGTGYLSRAKLTNANLSGTNLCGADLTGANLTGANLGHSVLDNVIGADFTGALNVPKKYLKD